MKKFAGFAAAMMTAVMALSACGGTAPLGGASTGAASTTEAAAEASSAEAEASAEATEAESTDSPAIEISSGVKAPEGDSAGAEESADGESDVFYIQEKGTLVVGITDFAPMDYQENGEWVGFDADLARKVAEQLGVACEFVVIDWDNKILELDNKSIDVVWNGMTLRPEVTNAMECTVPYLNNAQVVVVKSDVADQYQDEASLAELSFAVEAGSAGEQAAKTLGVDFTSVTAQADALMEVNSGTSDAAIIDLLMAGAMIGEGTSYADLTHTVQLNTEEYGIGCRKGSDLAAYINDALKAYETDGSLQEIAEQYGVQDALVKLN